MSQVRFDCSTEALASCSSREKPVSFPYNFHVFSVYTAPVDGAELQAVTQVRGSNARMLLWCAPISDRGTSISDLVAADSGYSRCTAGSSECFAGCQGCGHGHHNA
jgi:hypothetical protein